MSTPLASDWEELGDLTGPQGPPGVLAGYVLATDHGATGDGSTDDTTAIQAALDATPAGGVCFLPPGVYRTSSSLIVPPQVTLEGTHAVSLTYAGAPANPCVIRPLADGPWTGEAAVIRLLNETVGGYAADSVGQRISHLTIDGSGNATAGMIGIDVYGFVREAVFEHVTIRNVTGDGFACRSYAPYTGDAAAPQSLRFLDCIADNVGAAGFVIAGPDCLLAGCNAQGCGYVGYLIQYAPNTQLIGCRAEWAGNHNYLISGDFGTGQGSGGVLMTGCSSDRANYNGLLINSTGSSPHNITGCSFRRDGRNGGAGGGNYAGIQTTGTTNPVLVDGVTVFPGVDDSGTSTNSPQHGVRAGTSTMVHVASGYIHAATTAATDAGGNGHFSVAKTVGTATGTTAAPTRAAPAEMATQAALTAGLGGKADLVGGVVPDAQIPTGITRDSELTAAISAVIAGAPGVLDTLDELAAALGDDANYAATITNALALKAPLASPAFTGTPTGITKGHVGLGNVDNTADTAKPISTLQQAALDAKASTSALAGKQDVRANVRVVTSSETLVAGDLNRTVLVNSASSVTLTLMSASGIAGQRLTIVKIGAGPLILDGSGSELIMGQTTESISMQWGTRTLESDGTGWVAVSGKVDPVIATFADVSGGGSIALNAAAATLYRGRVTGTTATLAAPSNPIDGDVVNVEIYNSNASACALTIGSGIYLFAGTTSPISIPAGKMIAIGLRYRGTTSPATLTAGWLMVADRLQS